MKKETLKIAEYLNEMNRLKTVSKQRTLTKIVRGAIL